MNDENANQEKVSERVPAVRGVFGGVLMGLANLVPGISGGTMLLAAGVYTQFINAVAEVTTFRFRMRSLVILGTVVGGMLVAIVLGAGLIKNLVVEHRWAMYSAFIGLTLGGVPIIRRMLRPMNGAAWVGTGVGLAGMIALALIEQTGVTGGGTGDRDFVMLFVAGLVGGAAMILPGVSGGYLMLILGQYLIILGAIDEAKLAAQAGEWAVVGGLWGVFAAVGAGVVMGVVGVSNGVKYLLEHFEKATLGVLLGLLLGAVFGLWPFREPVAPEVGDWVKGVELIGQHMVDAVEREDWRLASFTPSVGRVLAALGLIGGGFACSWGVDRMGRSGED